MRLNVVYLTLRRLEKSASLNEYIWKNLSPYVSGMDVLEIGAGAGVYTEFLLKAKKNVTSIDIVPKLINALQKKFKPMYPQFETIALDVSGQNTAEKIKKRFDSIICLNVLEHIKDDQMALFNMAKLLKHNGKVILLLPAFKFLYGSLDKNAGHYRRYSYRDIKSKLEKTGFKTEKHFYLHFLGFFGWLVRSRVTGDSALRRGDIKLYEKLMPFFKFMDKITFRLMGQSLIVIARAKG